MFGIWGVLLGILSMLLPRSLSQLSLTGIKKSAVCMEEEGEEIKVNNSQRMLQALDEQDLTKGNQFFQSPRNRFK